MSKLHYKLGAGIGFVLLSSAALAASESEQALTTVTNVFIYAFILFVAIVGVLVYFMRLRDKRRTPLDALFNERETVHSVGPQYLGHRVRANDDRQTDWGLDRYGWRRISRYLYGAGCTEQSIGCRP